MGNAQAGKCVKKGLIPASAEAEGEGAHVTLRSHQLLSSPVPGAQISWRARRHLCRPRDPVSGFSRQH